jgi:ribonuclease HI
MGNNKKTAHILYADGQATVTSPYDADFVSELKLGLNSRRWNPEKKCWVVNIKERQKLIEITSKFYKVVEDNEPTDTPTPNSQYDAEPIEAPSGIEITSILKPGMEVEIWTDGASVDNPGPGGYGIIIKCREQKWERAGGFQLTTNNRMEIMGALVALEAIPNNCKATIYSDSQYLVNSIKRNWAKMWRSKGWKKKGNKTVPNADLWKRMLQLCDNHEVEFKWIKGHHFNVENNRCDRLAESAARKPNLPVDEGYTNAEVEN